MSCYICCDELAETPIKTKCACNGVYVHVSCILKFNQANNRTNKCPTCNREYRGELRKILITRNYGLKSKKHYTCKLFCLFIAFIPLFIYIFMSIYVVEKNKLPDKMVKNTKIAICTANNIIYIPARDVYKNGNITIVNKIKSAFGDVETSESRYSSLDMTRLFSDYECVRDKCVDTIVVECILYAGKKVFANKMQIRDSVSLFSLELWFFFGTFTLVVIYGSIGFGCWVCVIENHMYDNDNESEN